MSLSKDLQVFREPGFLVSAILVIVLVVAVLLIAGLALDPRVGRDDQASAYNSRSLKER